MRVENVEQWRELLARVERIGEVSLDLETDGLHFYEGNRLCMVAVYHPAVGAWHAPFRMHGTHNLPLSELKKLQPVLDSCLLVGHNIGSFDLPMLRVDGLNTHKARIFDTLPATILYDDSLPRFGLKALSVGFMGIDDADEYEKRVKSWLNSSPVKANYAFCPIELIGPYAEQDVRLAWELREKIEEPIWRRGDGDRLEADMEWAKFLGDLSWVGLGLDEDLTERYLRFCRVRILELRQKLAAQWYTGFNPGSPAQVKRWLMGNGVEINDTEEWTLRMLAESSPKLANMIGDVLEYRSYHKITSSWLEKYLTQARRAKDGRVRTDWGIQAQTGDGTGSGLTRTLRLRSSSPNLQAVPVDDEEGIYRVRSCFWAPDPEWELVSLDFSQVEVRISAHYANERRMLKELADPQGDVHSMVAKDLGYSRYRAKRINLGTIYDIGAAAFAEQLSRDTYKLVSIDDATNWLRQYRNRYPGFKRVTRQAAELFERRGWLRLWNGRITRRGSEDDAHKAFNRLVQMGVSEIVKEGILRVIAFNNQLGLRSRLVLQVHDELILEVPKEELSYIGDWTRILEGIKPESGWRTPLRVNSWHRRRWSDKLPVGISL